MTRSHHHHVHGGTRRDRRQRIASLDLPPAITSTVDSHSRLRGPYTAVGTILRSVVRNALSTAPELVAGHEVEILSMAPELAAIVPATRQTLTSLAVPSERTRYYSKLRSLRMTHGVVEFVRDMLAATGPRSLVVENIQAAEATDLEFLAVLLRRMDPALLTVVLGDGGSEPPGGPVAEAIGRYTVGHLVAPGTTDAVGADARTLAAEYVAGDCTSDEAHLRAAYDTLSRAERATLHDRRADELAAQDELSSRLGAIPFHREHGSDPTGAGVEALRFAIDHCSVMGFYHACIELSARARLLVGWDRAGLRYQINSRMTTSLAIVDLPAEAEALYEEARQNTTMPEIHMGAAYAIGMLYTRHHTVAERDHDKAKGWLNQAIAFASVIADPKERSFQSVFMRNGLALVELHLGHLDEALRLIDDGITTLDRTLAPDEHRLHRSVLRYNRAQVCAGLGRLEESVADYTAVITADPQWPEYYFHRGYVLQQLGRSEEALADYDTVLRLCPQFHEAYYNRGDLRAGLGDIDGALSDLDYSLELDPDFVAAYVNRAGIRLDAGDVDAAVLDAQAGLAREPDNPHLRVILGRGYAERERYAAALAQYDRAVEIAPDLITARSGRAAVAHELGDQRTALSDLGRAIELDAGDATLRYNRAFVLQAVGQWAAALADLTVAAELLPDDTDIATARDECRSRMAAA